MARDIGLTLGLLTAILSLAACGGKKQPAAGDGLIAFASNRDGNVDIYVMAPDGSGQRRLTTDSGSDRSPTWSPDGKRIAFVSDRVEGGNDEIFVMNADGGDEHQLTSGSVAGDFGPMWSPDGKKIAFGSQISWPGGSHNEVHVMNADGSDARRLTKSESFPAWSWSPDGTKIALTVTHGDDSAVYVTNADGSGRHRLLLAKTQFFGIAWSPDGSRIALDGGAASYVMNADGSGKRRLTDPKLEDAHFSAWSPDGKRIAFVVGRGEGFSESEIDFGSEIYVMNADGTRQRRLTRNSSDDYSPSWSPDGTRIVYTRHNLTKYCEPIVVSCDIDIYVMNADGSGKRRLTDNSSVNFHPEPSWSSGT